MYGCVYVPSTSEINRKMYEGSVWQNKSNMATWGGGGGGGLELRCNIHDRLWALFWVIFHSISALEKMQCN